MAKTIFCYVFRKIFKPTKLLEFQMTVQASLEVANVAADWVGFVAGEASCPCSQRWLQTEVDRWVFARSG